MKLIYHNDAFEYPGIGCTGICQVQIYHDPDEQVSLVLIIEDARNAHNTSVTNSSQTIHDALRARGLTVGQCTVQFVEILDNEYHNPPSFDWIIFGNGRHNCWRPTTRAEIERLIRRRIPNIRDGDERARDNTQQSGEEHR